MGKLDGKVALVTGGAEGIGATVGRMMVEEGAKVMLADVQIDKARALAEELGENAAALKLDVRELDQWHAAVGKVHEQFGKLNVLCNIAGISEPGNVVDVDLDSWRRTMDINLEGPFYGMRASIPAMEARPAVRKPNGHFIGRRNLNFGPSPVDHPVARSQTRSQPRCARVTQARCSRVPGAGFEPARRLPSRGV